MVGWRRKEQIQKPLSLLERKGIRVINALVQKIDYESRRVFTSNGDEPYDYLVIALGADTFPEKMPGFSEGAYNLYDLSGAEKIRETIEDFDKGHIIILITSKSFRCPAAPHEAALFRLETWIFSKASFKLRGNSL